MKHAIIAVLVLSLLSGSGFLRANQQPGPASLSDVILRADAALFDAFNRHDTTALMAHFDADLEFFHDTGGVTRFEETKTNFEKLFANTPDIRRDLIPGSVIVYPIKDFGAIQIGSHRFCHEENGKADCGTFGFTNIWQKTGETWKVTRALSYGHRP